jgi:replication-associated recombination protein RarA
MTLPDKYRPRSWDEVIGQDKAVRALRLMEGRGGFLGHAVWLSGKSGSGKTTLAEIAAGIAVPDPFYRHSSTGRSLTMGKLREWQELSRFAAPRAFIVNEAHGLCRPVIEELLDELEPVASHCLWMFTTTKLGMDSLFEEQIDAHPLLSRCKVIALADRPGAEQQATRLLEIARSEGLDGKELKQYVRLVNDNGGNWRKSLNDIESGVMLS